MTDSLNDSLYKRMPIVTRIQIDELVKIIRTHTPAGREGDVLQTLANHFQVYRMSFQQSHEAKGWPKPEDFKAAAGALAAMSLVPVMVDDVQLWKNHHATYDTKISHYEFQTIVRATLKEAGIPYAEQPPSGATE